MHNEDIALALEVVLTSFKKKAQEQKEQKTDDLFLARVDGTIHFLLERFANIYLSQDEQEQLKEILQLHEKITAYARAELYATLSLYQSH